MMLAMAAHSGCRTLDVLPPPRAPGLPGARLIVRKSGRPDLRWGRVGEGGDAITRLWRHLRKNRTTPTPNPSPQGGGERTEFAV